MINIIGKGELYFHFTMQLVYHSDNSIEFQKDTGIINIFERMA